MVVETGQGLIAPCRSRPTLGSPHIARLSIRKDSWFCSVIFPELSLDCPAGLGLSSSRVGHLGNHFSIKKTQA